MTEAKIIEILKQTPMFKNLCADGLSELGRKTVPRKLEKDEILFLAGDEARGLFIIVKGALRAYCENSDGREQVIHVERAPATIAEVPVFDNGVYPSNVAAEEDSVVLFISRENIRQLFLKYPQIALSALKLLSGRLRRVALLIEEISLHEVRERLARYLLTEARKQNPEYKEGVEINLKLTNQQIASRIGSVREVVSRTLNRLQQEKFIKIENRSVRVLDIKGLSQLIEK